LCDVLPCLGLLWLVGSSLFLAWMLVSLYSPNLSCRSLLPRRLLLASVGFVTSQQAAPGVAGVDGPDYDDEDDEGDAAVTDGFDLDVT